MKPIIRLAELNLLNLTDKPSWRIMSNPEYFNIGREYLLSFDDVTEEMVDVQLNAWKNQKLSSLPDVYKAILNHAKNRRGMPNSIGDIDNIKHLLHDFDHKKVFELYNDWGAIFDAVIEDDYVPRGRMEKDNNKNHWVIYCKAIYSAAEFLTLFETYDEFSLFIEGFWTNEYTKLSLPLLLSKEIFGFGFALACDFIKENISPEFLKPDTHIRDIALGLGITKSENDFVIYRDVEKYCHDIDRLPYEVDKLFWLVGSGKFYMFNIKIDSNKFEFINKAKKLTTL
ncbi:MAG: hypothetical protein GY795_42065 [Desulfobacterales bacterium]|nr:hypothetical protein [Desulfobacterales bacterium]